MNRPQRRPKRPKFLCILGCEGENQERLYFNKVQELVNNIEERTHDLMFDYAEPFGGDPKCVVERTITKSIGKTNRASIFDYDGKRKKFEEAIDLAKEHQIVLGYTNYCFDLWLILHKKYYSQEVTSQDGYTQELRRVYGLRKGANIKKREQVEKIIAQINLEDIRTAMSNAERITSDVKRTFNKTPQGNDYYDNPDTQLHIMLRTILKKVGVDCL